MTVLIPVRSGVARQRMQVELDRVLYYLTITWNEREGAWYLDVHDQTDAAIVSGRKLVYVVPPLYRSSDERRPLGTFGLIDPVGITAPVPTLEDLGERVLLLYAEEGDI